MKWAVKFVGEQFNAASDGAQEAVDQSGRDKIKIVKSVYCDLTYVLFAL